MSKQSPSPILKLVLTKSQEKLVKELEGLGIGRRVGAELVKASHPQAIKKWITRIKKKQKW